MKTISKIVSEVNVSPKPAKPARSVDGSLVEAINRGFTYMKLMHPKSFKRIYADDLNSIKELWALRLREFSGKAVYQAIHAEVDKAKYGAPELSDILNRLTEFKPEDHGFMSVDDAYDLATRNIHRFNDINWSDNAPIYFAILETRVRTLRLEKKEKSYPIFKENYLKICKAIADGADMTAPAYRLEKKEYSVTPSIRKARDKAMKSLGLKI